MAKWRSNPDLVIRAEDDGYTLGFNTQSGSGVILNPTSHLIFEQAVLGREIPDIVEALKREFDFAGQPRSDVELLAAVSEHVALLERMNLLLAAEPMRPAEAAAEAARA